MINILTVIKHLTLLYLYVSSVQRQSTGDEDRLGNLRKLSLRGDNSEMKKGERSRNGNRKEELCFFNYFILKAEAHIWPLSAQVLHLQGTSQESSGLETLVVSLSLLSLVSVWHPFEIPTEETLALCRFGFFSRIIIWSRVFTRLSLGYYHWLVIQVVLEIMPVVSVHDLFRAKPVLNARGLW